MLGQRLGPYRLEQLLGSGAFASVYLGRSLHDQSTWAVKVMDAAIAGEPEFRARFGREAQLAASLEHAHITRVHRFDVGGERPYIAMELVPGGTLESRIRGGAHLQDQIDRWIAEIAGALDHAHLRGVLHRDVKPSNVLISDQSGALLTDFGLARVVQTGGLTRSGLAIGSFAYMSPEQCRGVVRGLDLRSDVYSFSVLLFEICTAHVPFGRGWAAIEGHLHRPPPSVRHHNETLAPEVDEVLARGLAKSPADRYPGVGRLANDFLKVFARRGPVSFRAALQVGRLVFTFAEGLIWIGRDDRSGSFAPEVDLTPLDPRRTVSRRHALLTRDLRGSRVQDLGSANGTTVNGTRLPPRVHWQLREGDRLRFGEVEAVFSEAVATPTPAK